MGARLPMSAPKSARRRVLSTRIFALLGEKCRNAARCGGPERGRAAIAPHKPARPLCPLLFGCGALQGRWARGPDYFTRIQPGPLSMRDLANLYLYPNTGSFPPSRGFLFPPPRPRPPRGFGASTVAQFAGMAGALDRGISTISIRRDRRISCCCATTFHPTISM